jgi:hypothetical protein
MLALLISLIVTFITAKEGGRILIDEDGYEYIRTSNNEKIDRSYWQCRSRKKVGCPCRITLINSSNIIDKKSASHSHGNNLLKRKVNAFSIV